MNYIPSEKYGVEALKLYTYLMRATNAVTERLHKHLSNHKLSVSQFGALEALYHLGPLSQKEIGSKILKTSGNITMVIDNLEKRGLVSREKDLCDRRRIRVKNTTLGNELIAEILPYHSKVAQKIFSVLEPEEQQVLSRILKKLGKNNTGDSNDKYNTIKR